MPSGMSGAVSIGLAALVGEDVVCGIGETGLDYHYDPENALEQQELLVLPRLAPLELVLPAHLPPPSEPLEQGLVPQLRLGLQG